LFFRHPDRKPAGEFGLTESESRRRYLCAKTHRLYPPPHEAALGNADEVAVGVDDGPPAVPLVDGGGGDVLVQSGRRTHLARDDSDPRVQGIADGVDRHAGLDLGPQIHIETFLLRAHPPEGQDGDVVIRVPRDDDAGIAFAPRERYADAFSRAHDMEVRHDVGGAL